MAEEKEETTQSVYVRLTKDFVGTSRRRGPVVLTPGPRPELVEVTEAQLKALEADGFIEIVTEKEAKKWNDLHDAQNPEPIVETPADQISGDRAYEGDDKAKGDEAPKDDDEEIEVELSLDSKLADLKAAATEMGIEGLSKMRSKQEVLDAIEAKQADPADVDGE